MVKKNVREPKGKKDLNITLSGDAAVMVRKFAKITERNVNEVCSDAFRAYLWILLEQTLGGIVNARHENNEENRNLGLLVKNIKYAKKYLAPFRHLVRDHTTTVSIQQD